MFLHSKSNARKTYLYSRNFLKKEKGKRTLYLDINKRKTQSDLFLPQVAWEKPDAVFSAKSKIRKEN